MTDQFDNERGVPATVGGEVERIRWNRLWSLVLSAVLAAVALVVMGASPAAANPGGASPTPAARHRHGHTPPSELAAPNPRGSIGDDMVLPKGEMESSLSAPHHDYPAIDIAVVSGTPFYAITSGTATRLYQAGGCGIGVTPRGDDGVKYTYCHATRITATGRVVGGQQLGLTGSTGNATGPHLHLQMRYPASTRRCPQALLTALSTGMAPSPITSLPTRGCSY